MAKLLPTPYPLPSPMDFKAHQDAFDTLSAFAKTLDNDEYVGALLSWPVADGMAVYMVTDMKGSGTLQHVPFCDGYMVDAALIRGLRKADIIERVDRERNLDRMFGRRL